ncbi:MAG: outer membrane beta-barrel protein, partial [Pseudobdellovibrionaceae bacterium]
MKKILHPLAPLMLLLLPLSAPAMFTEMGLSYGRKKTTFDANNNYDSESTTGSISFYFDEKLALELSYTEATGIQNQQASPVDTPRTIYQKTQIVGADLIVVFADKKALFQPYVKGGAAQISRRQEIKDGNFPTQILAPDLAIAPSYGLGLKIALTETFGLKASYSIWQTPIGGGAKTNDDAVSAGVTWIF